MSSLSRRHLLKSLAVAGAATLLAPDSLRAASKPAKTGARKPNIIFIMADDLGLDGISCYGGDRYKTPNIDALAKGGTRFEYCYAAPVCGPTRAQLLTGRYPFRTGMTSNKTGPTLRPANEIMMPRVLKTAGYVSASVGKWSQLPLEPVDWGFDEYFRFQGSGVYYKTAGKKTTTVNGAVRPIPDGAYVPDMMHDFLIDFIKRHKNAPFYAYYSLSHVHGPIMRTPDSKGNLADFYADNIAYMDKLVGKLVVELDRLGLRENTLLVFTGDNGTMARFAGRGSVDGKNLSGAKGSMREGGSRVPLIANWKGTTPPGKVCADLTDCSDFFPTFASLAGADLPAKTVIDGRSFAPQLRGQTGTPREWVYVELMGFRYVANKKWKLSNGGELFDMKNAPFEEKLVPKDTTEPQAVAARQKLQGVLDGLVGKNAPVPTGPMTKKEGAKAKRGGQKGGRRKRRRRAMMAP